MLAEGDDDASLKRWIVKRLEDISDADSDVLADYVLALLRHDSPEAQVRQLSIEQLEDFLKDHTATFVDDIFRVIRTKAYLPGTPAVELLDTSPAGGSLGQENAAYDPKAPVLLGNGHLGSAAGHRRKRSYNEQEGGSPGIDRHSPYGSSASGERAFKQLRRGGPRGGRFDSFGGRGGRPGSVGPMQGQAGGAATMTGLPQPVTPGFPGMLPPGPPFPFDPNDPVAAFMAMQAMGFPPLPGLPGVPPLPPPFSPAGFGPDPSTQTSPGPGSQRTNRNRERCKDYDEKGFCALGGTCPYDHGSDHIVVPGRGEEYDPTNSAIVTDVKRSNSRGASGPPSSRGFSHDRGRGRGGGRGGPPPGMPQARRARAEFSHVGVNHDRSITTVVVENIPEDHFDEQAVREFFSAFGAIEEVQMQAYKRLALVKYDSWASAMQAYESPKVIFDNRFVKVYWYKPNGTPGTAQRSNGTAGAASPTSASGLPSETELDEMRKKQEELQQAHEDKMKKIKEREESRRQLERRKEELLRSQAEEKRRLMEKLAARAGKADRSSRSVSVDESAAQQGKDAGSTSPVDGAGRETNSQTQALKAQLAALEAEARSLGIDATVPDESGPAFRGRGRGRGFYRGRAGYVPRGRGGFNSHRGGYSGRGRAGPHGWAARAGAHKIDNRPKRVAVSGVEFDDGKDEALRQYLLSVGEFENIEPNPDRPDSQVITFKDRFTAQKFFAGSSEIPAIGAVELSWISNPSAPLSAEVTSASNTNDGLSTTNHQEGREAAPSAPGDASRQEQSPMPASAPAPGPGPGPGPASASASASAPATGVAAQASHPAEARGAAMNEDYDVADDTDRWMTG